VIPRKPPNAGHSGILRQMCLLNFSRKISRQSCHFQTKKGVCATTG
jgi:hypothetical protein